MVNLKSWQKTAIVFIAGIFAGFSGGKLYCSARRYLEAKRESKENV